MAQIDWQRSEWQCVRMVIDQLIDQVVELSKELQDSRRNYGDALSKTSSQDNLISRLHQTIRDLNEKNSINSIYIEALENELALRGVSCDDLDAIYNEIKAQYEGGDE